MPVMVSIFEVNKGEFVVIVGRVEQVKQRS